jgi:hypothetical protein
MQTECNDCSPIISQGECLLKFMYLDESGDHSLEKIDPDYPVFVLGGIIVDGVQGRKAIDSGLNQLKTSFFGRDDLVLHTSDILRARNGFESLSNPVLRRDFYRALNALMRDLEFQVVACVIRKDEHLALYGANAIDPYLLSLRVLVERFCQEIGGMQNGGIIYAERRGLELDGSLEFAWMDILKNGTPYKRGGEINSRIVDLSLKGKRLNIGGLQLADLVVSPIGKVAIGKAPHEDWEIVKKKFRQGPTGYEGFGLVVMPRRT